MAEGFHIPLCFDKKMQLQYTHGVRYFVREIGVWGRYETTQISQAQTESQNIWASARC